MQQPLGSYYVFMTFLRAAKRPSRTIEETGGWLAQVDDFRTFLGDFVSNMPQVQPIYGEGPHLGATHAP